MTYDDLISYFGNEPKAGEAIGVPRQTVHRWKGREIPTDPQLAYEVATNGKLLADIPNEVRVKARAA